MCDFPELDVTIGVIGRDMLLSAGFLSAVQFSIALFFMITLIVRQVMQETTLLTSNVSIALR